MSFITDFTCGGRRSLLAVAALAALASPLAMAQGKGEIRIAHVYSKTGPLEAYGKQTQTGFMMGLDYATGGMSAATAIDEALKKTGGDTSTDKLIKTMEGMTFESPKGKMTFRKEDHQAMQSMFHFRIKADP